MDFSLMISRLYNFEKLFLQNDGSGDQSIKESYMRDKLIQIIGDNYQFENFLVSESDALQAENSITGIKYFDSKLFNIFIIMLLTMHSLRYLLVCRVSSHCVLFCLHLRYV